jgi:CRISPR-associated protein Csm2
MSYQSSPQRSQFQGNRPAGDSKQSDVLPTIAQSDLQKIIADGDVETLVSQAKIFSPKLTDPNWKEGERLTTSQIRAIFGEVRQIEGQWKVKPDVAMRRLYLVKPKLAYRARKENKNGVKALANVLDKALDLVYEERDVEKRQIRFRRFVEMFEAILAYHTGK